MDAERLAAIEQRIKDLSAELSELQREVMLARLSQPRQLSPEEGFARISPPSRPLC